ncbi:MAG: translocation/assembly module TamB domain-containing protein [Bacteroidota bacterium]|nr:translocation/assembly module TamB domain-containing protein [Bacteroidota bacterium]
MEQHTQLPPRARQQRTRISMLQLSVLQRVARAAALLLSASGALVLIAGVALYALAHTAVFNRWLAQVVTALVRDQLNAELSIGSVRVDIFQGVQLDSVLLVADGDTVVFSPHIELRYTPEALLFRTVAITALRIESPRLLLVRGADSTWNISRIIRPSSEPAGEPPSLLIYLRLFEISDGAIAIHDALSPSDTTGRFDPFHAELENVQLRATGLVHLRQQRYTLAIDALSWRDHRSGWGLAHLQGIVEADTTALRIPALRVALPQSHVHVEQAVLDYAGPHLSYRGRIRVDSLAPADCWHLLPPDIAVGKTLALEASLDGTDTSMQIDLAELTTGASRLRGRVQLAGLAADSTLRWKVAISNAFITFSDLKALLPQLALPQLPAVSTCRIDQLWANGAGEKVATQLRAMLPVAELDIRAQLRFARVLEYTFSGTVRNANLSLLDSTLPQSVLHAQVQMEGRGTDPSRATARVLLQLDSSRIRTAPITHATIVAHLAGGIVTLDTLEALLPSSEGDAPARISAHGSLALHPPHHLTLELVTEHLSLSQLLDDPLQPELLSAAIHLRSSGGTLDSLVGSLEADISELVFRDRAVFPFHLHAHVGYDGNGKRAIVLQSPQIEAEITGNFTLSGLARMVSAHTTLADTLLASIQNEALGGSYTALPPVALGDTLDATVHIRVQSLSLLSPLLSPLVLEMQGLVHGQLRSDGTSSHISFDTIAISRLVAATPGGFYLASMPLDGALSIQWRDLRTAPQVAAASIRVAIDSVLRIGALRIVRPQLQWLWDGTHAVVETGTAWIENTMPFAFRARIIPHTERSFTLRLEKLRVGVSPTFTWRLAEPFDLREDAGLYAITAAHFVHEQSAAQLDIDGTVSADECHLHVMLRSFDLPQLEAIPALASVELVQQIGGQIDSLLCEISGPWKRPHLSLTGRIVGLAYGTISVGEQDITLNYDGTTLRGGTTLFIPAGLSKRTALDLRVESLPLTLSLVPFESSIRQHELISIYLHATDLPMATIEPFLPALSQLHGTINATANIYGTLPGTLGFKGTARYDHAEFLVTATNIRYRSRGVISLENNVLRLDTLELYNDPADLIGGFAQISGAVIFSGFQPDSLDISVRIPGSRGLLVMSNATAAVNSTMYGRVVLSTEEGGQLRRLWLHGTIAQPRLDGFVSLEDADVTFPPSTDVTVQTSSFRYLRAGEGYLVTDLVTTAPREDTTFGGDLPPRSEQERAPVRLSLSPGFSERLYTAVDVKIRRQMRVKMDFSSVEQLVAFVEQENRADYLRFIREGNRRTELRGTLVVDPSSTYKFYSTFAAGGRLRFVTGAIDNPEVDLRAVYDGERVIGSDNRREQYRIVLYITGTKRQPRVRMTYYLNGEEAPGTHGDSTRIMTNALLLLLFGRTQEELTGGGSGRIATTALDQSVNAARSAAVSAFLTNALQGGVIKNVNIDFGSSDVTSLSQARIMLTGQLFGANVTIGGSVADLAQNSQIMLDLSIGNALGIEWLRNLIAQFQATANPGQSLSRQQKQWEFRLGWRVP